jgi:hypothetical protein
VPKLSPKEIRRVTIHNNNPVKSEVIQGSSWSPREERVMDECVGLADGIHLIEFVPVGVNKGADTITRVKITTLFKLRR